MKRALATGMGLGALAATESEDAEASFLGTGSKLADHFMLGVAKRMEYQGYDRDNIWQTTGWGRGTDGHWRFEVNDSDSFKPIEEAMSLLPDPPFDRTIEMNQNALAVERNWRHDLNDKRIGWSIAPRDYTGVTGGADLIGSYPAMAHVDIPATIVNDPVDVNWKKADSGSMTGLGTTTAIPPFNDGALLHEPEWNAYSHDGIKLEDGTMHYLNPPVLRIPEVFANQAAFDADGGKRQAIAGYQSIMAHETQHGIQQLEGWGRGGAPSSAVADAKQYTKEEKNLLDDYVDEIDPLILEYDRAVDRMDRMLEIQGEDGSPDLFSDDAKRQFDEAANDLEFLNTRFPYLADAHRNYMGYYHRYNRVDGLPNSAGMGTYKNLAGEVEARNTQTRLNWSDEQRRKIPPWETEDVKRNLQYTGTYANKPVTYSETGGTPGPPIQYGFLNRLVGDGVLANQPFYEIQDLVRGGMDEAAAGRMVAEQWRIDQDILENNADIYTDWRTATREEQAEMLENAERLRHENLGKNKSPYFAAGATGAGVLATALANLDSIVPRGTANAVSELGVLDSGIAAADTAVRAGQGFLNDIITGGTMVTNAVADQDYEPYEVDIDPGTAQGDTLAGGLMEDMGRLFQYKGVMGNMPSAVEMIGGGIDLYNEHVKPHLSDRMEEGLGGAALLAASLPFVPSGRSTIRNALRKDYPGIYQSPDDLLDQVTVEPETGVLEQVFGATRQDLADIGRTRQGNQPAALPNAAARPKGTAHGSLITKPANTGRLVNALENAMGSELEKGMSGWYVMDPLYDAYKALGLSDEEAARRFKDFQAFTGIHSSASDVKTELTRGTGALYLNEQGRMDDYVKYGGKVGQPGAPDDMSRFPGHFAHKTAHGVPLLNYIENGALTMKSPKVPLYIQSAGVPQTGFQTEMPVGDAHFSRAIGLADVRPDKGGATDESWTTPEAQELTPWWRDDVAGQVGLESVPAQALAWGLFSPQTGVDTAVGVPKLEILAQMIKQRAKERGISVEQARDEILMGQDYVSSLATK